MRVEFSGNYPLLIKNGTKNGEDNNGLCRCVGRENGGKDESAGHHAGGTYRYEPNEKESAGAGQVCAHGGVDVYGGAAGRAGAVGCASAVGRAGADGCSINDALTKECEKSKKDPFNGNNAAVCGGAGGFFRYPGGRTRAFTMSYDDGTEHDIKQLEIMNRYGVRGTFNVMSRSCGIERYRQPDGGWAGSAAGLYEGHEVAGHSATHPHLELLSEDRLKDEIIISRGELEGAFARPVLGFAYPYGTYSSDAVNMLRAGGIMYARTTKATFSFYWPSDFLLLHPTCHHRDLADDFSVADAFLTTESPLPFFYLWGHSFEFDRNGNWQLLEKICSYLGGRDDVWYCTNIEAVEYITALLRVYIKDGRVYNPTDRVIYCGKGKIEPNGSVKI